MKVCKHPIECNNLKIYESALFEDVVLDYFDNKIKIGQASKLVGMKSIVFKQYAYRLKYELENKIIGEDKKC